MDCYISMRVILDLSTRTETRGDLIIISCPELGTTGTGKTRDEAISDLIDQSRTLIEASISSSGHLT
ncbi:MAG: hypothetical protein JXA22_09050 [Candidatus Thermoplasmatota archaeon]|nr:hypothetical protein [Candidatus Thermoplasmatota archaeon]